MRKISKLVSILCPILIANSRFYSAKEQNSNTLEIKVRCAGSGHTSPFKIKNSRFSRDYLESEGGEYEDLNSNMPYINVDSECNMYWYTDQRYGLNSYFNKSLKKKDLFFKIKNQKDHLSKLELLRPGVGADDIFSGKENSKFLFISLPTGSLDVGQFSIGKTSNIVSKALLYYIDNISSLGGNLNIKLQGHSRGAVGIARALNKLLSELNKDKYLVKLKDKKIKINCVLVDPVAGPDVMEKKLDLISRNPSVDLKLTQLFVTDVGFEPWKHRFFSSSAYIPDDISNSTIVFLPLNHDVGQRNAHRDQNGKYRKPMWKYQDQLLKYGDIGNLDPGVYFPKTKFSFDNSSDNNNIIKLDSDRAPSSYVIPPIELEKLTNCDNETLSTLQDHLLLDEQWIKNGNRKNTFLKLLNRSLHINEILSPKQNLDFNSNFKLRISKNKS